MAFLAISVSAAALAQEEPYATTTVPEEAVEAAIVVSADGLTVTFSVAGATGPCVFDFGDGTSAQVEGTTVTHTFSSEGTFTITATCGAVVLSETITVSSVPTTGYDFGPWALGGLALIVLGGLAVRGSRRRDETGSDS